MSFIHETTQTVPFHDLDPVGIVWHGNYMKYFDVARFALFRAAGLELHEYVIDQKLIFPITKTSTKHIVPLKDNDKFICKATVTEAVNKISIDFEIRMATDSRICARSRQDQLAVRMPEMEILFEIPEEITRALGFA